ncbi:MAG: hypothetical protein FJ191_11325 [Gammaproteobacteria bacterium]|nr:hypothetical protein [Gammaproteobacteria bacterium]
MKKTNRLHLFHPFLLLLGWLALGAAPALAGDPPAEILIRRGAVADHELPPQAARGSGIAGDLNAAALSALRLRLDLADGRVLVAERQRELRDARRGEAWVGAFQHAPGSLLVLSRWQGAVTGFFHEGADVYEIAPGRGGRHLLYRVDESRLPPVGPLQFPPPDAFAGDDGGTVPDATATAGGDGIVQDLLVLYTPAARTRYQSSGGVESRIVSAIAAANQAYANSGLALSLNLVHMAETQYVETGDMSQALSALRQNGDGVMDEAHALRDQYGADLVALVDEDGNYCGIGYVMTSVSTSFAGYAFSVTASNCLSGQTLAHEVGHNQGNMHNREDSSNAGAYPYSYGYRRCVTDGTGFRTVMSYSCTGAPRVNYFANPNVYYNGYATGISYELDPANSAEAARSMGNTAATVAAFRQGAATEVPVAPSALAATPVSAARVDLQWSDNSSTETGFIVERSGNGVDYSQIAALGANVTGYSDNGVTALTNYWYRVRAWNSVGNSAPSNVATVTTPDLPPAAPANVTAAVAGAQVTVGWSDLSGNETRFEIGRESYNSKNRRWSSMTVVGTAAANATSWVESPASGTYRYSVRAVNGGGSSAWVGPSAAVTVAGSGGGKGRNK